MSVLPFPRNGEPCAIPRPACHKPGYAYASLNFVDEQYAHIGFRPGAVLIVQFGRLKEDLLTYVEVGGEGFLARPTEINPSTVRLQPLDNVTPEKTYQRAELTYVGTVIEIYPQGLNGSRWVLYPTDVLDSVQPVVEAIAN